MQRKTAVYTLAASVILSLGVPVAQTLTAHTRPAHAARHAEGVTACGVERWRVKVGLDQDARRVKQKVVILTTIGHLRSLRPPATLPRTSRVRPVETTVWAVDGTQTTGFSLSSRGGAHGRHARDKPKDAALGI
jgi:hypothetical protein